MTNVELPALLCRKLSDFDGEDLASVRREFYKSVPCQLKQSWLPVSQQELEAGLVYTGWKDSDLFVFAELTDADIFTSAKEPGDHLWRLGDTFEIFLGRPDQEAYYEFHVAPNNLKLQFHFLDGEAAERVSRTQRFEDLMMKGNAFVSQTWVKPEIKRWFVLGRVLGTLLEPKGELAGARWSISFCRYDYTRGKEVPVISSASSFTKADFHRRHEWGAICFE
jgi:hypothetical protein